MPIIPQWARAIPTDIMGQGDLQDLADQWAKDQQAKLAQDWGDQQTAASPPPTRDDWASGNLNIPSGGPQQGPPAPAPEPAAGAPVSPPAASAPVPPPAVSAPAPAASAPSGNGEFGGAVRGPDSDFAPRGPVAPSGGGFSPYDDVFRKYAGQFADDPEFVKIVAAGTLAESSWNANSTTGDGGHSWGLFQMHDRGAGAGMGNARLDPDQASAVMVPKYAAAYAALKDKLSGPALAAAVAQSAERSADPTGSAYAAAYRTLSNGNAPNVVSSAKDWLGQQAGNVAGAVGNAAGGAANAIGNALPTFNPPMPPAVAEQAATGRANPFDVKNQTAESLATTLTGGQSVPVVTGVLTGALDPANLPGGIQNELAQVATRAVGKIAGPLLGQLVTKAAEFVDRLKPPAEAFASTERPLFGRGGVPGADVGRNPVPAGTQPQDLPEALAQSGLQVVIKQARDAGMADNDIATVFRSVGASEDQIAAALHPPAQPTMPVSDWQTQLANLKGTDTYQGASPAEQTQMVADAQGQFGTEQANGAAPPQQPPPPAPPGGPQPPEGPQGPPLNMLTQAERLPPPSGPTGALSSVFQPMANLPPEAQQALKEYAAAVGPDSNAARVQAQQDARALGQAGVDVDQGALASSNRLDAQQTLFDKLDALGLRNDPQVQSVIKNIETPSAIANNPLGHALLQVQNEVKGVIFPLSMFHTYTEGLYSTFSRPGGGPEFAAAFFSNAPTEAAQASPMWVRAAKAGVTQLMDRNAPDAPNTLGGLQGAAVRSVIGGVGGAGTGYTGTKIAGGTDEQARQNALIAGLAGAVGAPLAKPLISDNLWRAVQFSKVKTFEGLVNGGLDDQAAADAVNRTFGGLNYAQMGRSRTLQDVLRLTVQAPDWNEATVRSLGASFFGRAGGAGFSRGVLARTVLGTALATEALNMVFTGHPTYTPGDPSASNEPGHEFQVQLPEGTADKPVYIGIGPGNLQAYMDLGAKIASKPQDTLERDYYSRGQSQREAGNVPQFLLNRAGVLPSEAIAGLTGGQSTFAGARAPLPAEMAAPLAPISIGNIVEEQMNGMSPQASALLTAAGFNPRYGAGQKKSNPASRAPRAPSAPRAPKTP